MPAGTCNVLIGVPRSRSHHAAPTVGCPANGSSRVGVWMCACALWVPSGGKVMKTVSL